MPNLAAQLQLPFAPKTSDKLPAWASALLGALQSSWSGLIYVVNALDRRPMSPGTLALADGTGLVMTKRLTLSSDNRLTLAGTSRMRIT